MIDKMVREAYPEFTAEVETNKSAFESNQDWLRENGNTENEKDAARLIVESNKEARLKRVMAEQADELIAKEKDAKEYWQSFHAAEIASKGIKAVRKMADAMNSITLNLPSYAAARNEVNNELKSRDAAIISFGKMQQLRPMFVDTLPVVKES